MNKSNREKVVYKATTPPTGLSNDKIYYVFKTDKDKIKLTERFSDIDKGIVISIDSVGGTDHELLQNKSTTQIIKNDTISFDVSDTSISEMDLEFYEDPDFTRRLELIGNVKMDLQLKELILRNWRQQVKLRPQIV